MEMILKADGCQPPRVAMLHRTKLALACVALLPIAPIVHAQVGLGGSVGAGFEHSDNVARSGTDGVAGNMGLLYLGANAAVDRSGLVLRLDTNLNYRDYFNSDIEPQLTGGAIANLAYALFGEYLELGVLDRYGWNRQINPTNGVQSFQKYNDVTGSGQLTIPIGNRTAIVARDEYSTVTSGSANTQNDRNTVSVTLRQRLSVTTSIFATGSRESVRFNRLADTLDYDINEISGGFSADLQRTDFDVSVGKTKIEGQYDLPASSLLRATISRQFGSRILFQINAGNIYSNYSRNFVSVQDLAGVDQESLALTATADPFKSTYGSASLTWTGVRNTLTILYRESKEKHQIQSSEDVTQTFAELDASHRFSGRTSVYLRSGYTKLSENEQIGKFYDVQVRLGMRLSIAQSFALDPYVESYTGEAAGVGKYRERRAGVMLEYLFR